jgi:hypothetical protein
LKIKNEIKNMITNKIKNRKKIKIKIKNKIDQQTIMAQGNSAPPPHRPTGKWYVAVASLLLPIGMSTPAATRLCYLCPHTIANQGRLHLVLRRPMSLVSTSTVPLDPTSKHRRACMKTTRSACSMQPACCRHAAGAGAVRDAAQR